MVYEYAKIVRRTKCHCNGQCILPFNGTEHHQQTQKKNNNNNSELINRKKHFIFADGNKNKTFIKSKGKQKKNEQIYELDE